MEPNVTPSGTKQTLIWTASILTLMIINTTVFSVLAALNFKKETLPDDAYSYVDQYYMFTFLDPHANPDCSPLNSSKYVELCLDYPRGALMRGEGGDEDDDYGDDEDDFDDEDEQIKQPLKPDKILPKSETGPKSGSGNITKSSVSPRSKKGKHTSIKPKSELTTTLPQTEKGTEKFEVTCKPQKKGKGRKKDERRRKKQKSTTEMPVTSTLRSNTQNLDSPKDTNETQIMIMDDPGKGETKTPNQTDSSGIVKDPRKPGDSSGSTDLWGMYSVHSSTDSKDSTEKSFKKQTERVTEVKEEPNNEDLFYMIFPQFRLRKT